MNDVVRRWGLAAVVAAGTAAGCARLVPPPVVAPGPDRYPDYPRPDLPPDLAAMTRPARDHDTAWRLFQSGDARAAERTLRAVLERAPGYYPSQTALGFVTLARGEARGALQTFDRVLAVQPAYVPALVGRGEALLELGREGEAFESYLSALEAAPDHPLAQRRVEVLRFRAVQSDVSSAQAALAAGRLAEARDAYDRALKASPDSGFLYRDLANVERQLDNRERAQLLVNKAIELDAQDARAYAVRGQLAHAAGQDEAALADYRKALALDPGLADVAERMRAIETGLEEAALPAELRAIKTAPSVTRGDVAALLAHRMPALLQGAARGTVLITDGRRHWAQQAMLLAARAGAMEVYPNHTFQPASEMNRGEFAAVVHRVLNLIGARAPQAARAWQDARAPVADVLPGHPLFVPISRALASGVLQTLDGQTFGMTRPMSGVEAVAAVERLAAIAQQAGVLAAAGSRAGAAPR